MEKEHQKIQVVWGVCLFHKFILFAQKRGCLQDELIQDTVDDLLKSSKEEADPASGAEALNQANQKANTPMKDHRTHFLQYAPFPNFSFVKEGHERCAAIDQLDMLQRTLTVAADAKLIDSHK